MSSVLGWTTYSLWTDGLNESYSQIETGFCSFISVRLYSGVSTHGTLHLNHTACNSSFQYENITLDTFVAQIIVIHKGLSLHSQINITVWTVSQTALPFLIGNETSSINMPLTNCSRNERLHCNVEFRTSPGYILSVQISTMTYTGSSVQYCLYGGVVLYTEKLHVKNAGRKAEELATMCHNISQVPTRNSNDTDRLTPVYTSPHETVYIIAYTTHPGCYINTSLLFWKGTCQGINIDPCMIPNLYMSTYGKLTTTSLHTSHFGLDMEQS